MRHQLNLHHVIVESGLLAAIVPFDGYARPILLGNSALMIFIILPANAVANVEKSGLFAGH